jgi:hypothetical protein
MWRRRLTARSAVALGCIALVAAGAGVAVALTRDQRLCTLIGGMTGVTVHLGDADLRDTDRARVCVEGRCNRLGRQVAGVLSRSRRRAREWCSWCSCSSAMASGLICG